jgi:predicted transcriptional regulator
MCVPAMSSHFYCNLLGSSLQSTYTTFAYIAFVIHLQVADVVLVVEGAVGLGGGVMW